MRDAPGRSGEAARQGRGSRGLPGAPLRRYAGTRLWPATFVAPRAGSSGPERLACNSGASGDNVKGGYQ